jgi:hypothetical protein
MEWIPIVLGTFKAVVLCTGMFFAIKWHYDQGQKEEAKERQAVLRTGGKVVTAFLLSLLVLGFVTFVFSQTLGLDLSFP